MDRCTDRRSITEMLWNTPDDQLTNLEQWTFVDNMSQDWDLQSPTIFKKLSAEVCEKSCWCLWKESCHSDSTSVRESGNTCASPTAMIGSLQLKLLLTSIQPTNQFSRNSFSVLFRYVCI